MKQFPPIRIGESTWHKNGDVDRYQIPFDQLHDLRLRDIPENSHLEILGLTSPPNIGGQIYAVNDGASYFVYGGPDYITAPENLNFALERIRLSLPENDALGRKIVPKISILETDGQSGVSAYLSADYDDKHEMSVVDAIHPFSRAFQILAKPMAKVFVCHASEDKTHARRIAAAVRSLGTDVWFDEWEIRIGDSIVQKINEALGEITHLVVLLSNNSVSKPWVKREISSALMTQLADESIRILPIRLDDCTIPPILHDLKYVSYESGLKNVVAEISNALMAASNGQHAT